MNTLQTLVRLAALSSIVFLQTICFAQTGCPDPDNFTTDCGTVFDLCIDYSSTDVNKPVYISVTANDEAIFDPCDIILPLDADLLPQNGSVIKTTKEDANCAMLYTPDEDFVGLDSFDYNFITKETCNNPEICPNGKIWSMTIIYYGPSGLDVNVTAKQGGSTITVTTINSLQSGTEYFIEGVTPGLATNQTEWTFAFSDDTEAKVHTSCSAEILGVDFGYFMPVSGCAAPFKDRCGCIPAGCPTATGRSMAASSGSVIQDFTRVFIVIESLLPIDFTYMVGRAVDQANVVEWGIASVYDEEHLMLQRSDDGIVFEDLMFYDQIETGDFQYNDQAVRSRKSYYRLKSISFTGEESYSEILAISNYAVDSQEIVAFPIPSNNLITISSDQEIASVQLVDMTGRVALHLNEGHQKNVQISARQHNLAPGIYLSNIQLANGSQLTKRLQIVE